MEQYQDIWINGQLDKKGIRECEDRYKIMKKFCEDNFDRPFTCVDIGANLGYFSIRLAEDFPDSVFVMIESPQFYLDWLNDILLDNALDNVILLGQHTTQRKLAKLAEVEHFDLVLAMSVVHHINGNINQTVELVKNLGTHTIIEMPVERNACGQNKVQLIDWDMFSDDQILGYGKSHLQGDSRPIYHLTNDRNTLERPFLGALSRMINKTMEIDYTKSYKFAVHKEKNRKMPWIEGINLWTFRNANGIYPHDWREELMELMEDMKDQNIDHGDIRPWNIIIGKGLTMIDFNDDRRLKYDDKKSIQIMLDWAEGSRVYFEDLELAPLW